MGAGIAGADVTGAGVAGGVHWVDTVLVQVNEEGLCMSLAFLDG